MVKQDTEGSDMTGSQSLRVLCSEKKSKTITAETAGSTENSLGEKL